ncbi:MAG TPA: hypothetical protein VHU89_00525 [Acidobacteriaceae bacterium]|nr:hypothetical protein [Acidobacteriaceae bacterium]
MRVGLISALLLAAAAAGQTPGKPAAPAMRTFTDSALHLTFSYPAELAPMDPKAATALGQRMLYGEDGANGAKKMKSGAGCTRTLLAVGEEGRVRATLVLFQIDLSCVPPKAAKNRKLMDQVLNGLSSQGNEVLGMMPIEEPAGFLLQGHHAFFAAAQGTPVAAAALQNGEAQVTATVAAEVEGQDGQGKILAWHVESSSATMFNRLLASPVDLGTGQAQALFPAAAR